MFGVLKKILFGKTIYTEQAVFSLFCHTASVPSPWKMTT